MRAIIRAACIVALLLPAAAFGQQRIDDYVVNLGILPSGAAHALTLDSSNALYVDCLAGCGGGGGGGTVAQGAAGSSAWLTSDSALDALISGGKLPVSGTFWQTTQPVSDATLGIIGAATSPTYMHVGGCVYTAAGVTLTNGQSAATSCAADNSQFVRVNGTAATQLTVQTSGGAAVYTTNVTLNAATSALSANIKTSAGQVYDYTASNSTAASAYCRLFNISSAPTVGTSTPSRVFLVPASGTVSFSTDLGLAFGTGIAVDCTSGSMANSDTGTFTTAGTVAVTIDFK